MNLISRAAVVALTVGSVLLIINQYDALFGTASVRYLPALLTYCVPFFVFLVGKKMG